MPRTKKKTATAEKPIKGVKHNSKFGWCSTGHHNQCRTKYIDWNKIEQECNCSCHKNGVK